ncbi:extracellular solute-binding protein [Streptomyces profundus]|uniref:extracellular solute-binding protein n=1 Tax=Streptomyces profundus TaxID=2867410 RepID=UPI001D16C00A|nr:extracellular solute-binding protein [Streptomyces sp. MA3_2.13]UED84956.1 extracellular solute-binding protein [Streptomyces sp. MA3_2.13]
MRRTRRALTVPALLLVLAAACTAGGEAPDEPVLPVPPDDVPLVVVSGSDLTGPEGGVRRALIDRWNEVASVKAELVELPATANEQRAELIGGLQSGVARYDVLNLDVTWIPEFAEAGLIGELDEELAAPAFVADTAVGGWWRDRLYAVPFNTDVGLLYYRDDLISGADLRNGPLSAVYGRMVTRGEGVYVTQLRPYEGLTVNTLEALWSVVPEAELVDGRGAYAGSVEEWERGLTELAAIANVTPGGPEISAASFDADESAAIDVFAVPVQERTDGEPGNGPALMRNWPFALNRVAERADPALRIGATTLPGPGALGGQSLAVAANSPRAEMAQRLISFLTADPDNQEKLLEAGFAPALEAAYGFDENATPDCADQRPVERESGRSSDEPWRPERAEYAALLWCALDGARARPATPYYQQFSAIIQEEVTAMLTRGSGQNARMTAENLHRRLPLALEGRLDGDQLG